MCTSTSQNSDSSANVTGGELAFSAWFRLDMIVVTVMRMSFEDSVDCTPVDVECFCNLGTGHTLPLEENNPGLFGGGSIAHWGPEDTGDQGRGVWKTDVAAIHTSMKNWGNSVFSW